jgi:membrane-associated HD superfamily phosphohydrolase
MFYTGNQQQTATLVILFLFFCFAVYTAKYGVANAKYPDFLRLKIFSVFAGVAAILLYSATSTESYSPEWSRTIVWLLALNILECTWFDFRQYSGYVRRSFLTMATMGFSAALAIWLLIDMPELRLDSSSGGQHLDSSAIPNAFIIAYSAWNVVFLYNSLYFDRPISFLVASYVTIAVPLVYHFNGLYDWLESRALLLFAYIIAGYIVRW